MIITTILAYLTIAILVIIALTFVIGIWDGKLTSFIMGGSLAIVFGLLWPLFVVVLFEMGQTRLLDGKKTKTKRKGKKK